MRCLEPDSAHCSLIGGFPVTFTTGGGTLWVTVAVMGQNYSDSAAKATVGVSSAGEWKKRLRVRRRRRREDKSPAEELTGRGQPPSRSKLSTALNIQQPGWESRASASPIDQRGHRECKADAGWSTGSSTVLSIQQPPTSTVQSIQQSPTSNCRTSSTVQSIQQPPTSHSLTSSTVQSIQQPSTSHSLTYSTVQSIQQPPTSTVQSIQQPPTSHSLTYSTVQSIQQPPTSHSLTYSTVQSIQQPPTSHSLTPSTVLSIPLPPTSHSLTSSTVQSIQQRGLSVEQIAVDVGPVQQISPSLRAAQSTPADPRGSGSEDLAAARSSHLQNSGGEESPSSSCQGTAPSTQTAAAPDMRLDGQGGRLRRDMSKCDAAKPGMTTAKERVWLEDGGKNILETPNEGLKKLLGDTELAVEGAGRRVEVVGRKGDVLETLDHAGGNWRGEGRLLRPMNHHTMVGLCVGEQTSTRTTTERRKEVSGPPSGGVVSHVTISVGKDQKMGANRPPPPCPAEELWTSDSGIGGLKLTITPPETDCAPKTAQSADHPKDSLLYRRGPPYLMNPDTHTYAIPRLIVTRDVSPKRCVPPSLSPQFHETGFSLDVPFSGDAESPCSDSGCGGSPVPSLFLRKLSSSSGLSSASSFEESEDDFIGSDLEPSGLMVCSPDEQGASIRLLHVYGDNTPCSEKVV